jgi:hypothetical protein
MTKSRLERLLSKKVLSDNNKEDLLDYKYFLLEMYVVAYEKGLMTAYSIDNPPTKYGLLIPKNKFWITNINHFTKGFESKYYI